MGALIFHKNNSIDDIETSLSKIKVNDRPIRALFMEEGGELLQEQEESFFKPEHAAIKIQKCLCKKLFQTCVVVSAQEGLFIMLSKQPPDEAGNLSGTIEDLIGILEDDYE